MTDQSPWRTLKGFRNSGIPKLDNLRRAAKGGLRVPPTMWASAKLLAGMQSITAPKSLGDWPLIIRSGSPTEDTRQTSNAGQLVSEVAQDANGFAIALDHVIAALPRDGDNSPLGVLFVQPLVAAHEAGVAFLDGFYYERSTSAESNAAVTSGQERGLVTRGHLERNDPWSAWLTLIYSIFGGDKGDQVLDIEFARITEGYILLQVRPALFAVRRNETLSLANHKEILGDLPSPWIVSVLEDAGKTATSFYSAIDPNIATWNACYAFALAGRAWMNFSFFYRLLDQWGLPRAFVTEGMGGEATSPGDRAVLPARFLRAIPSLVRLQFASLKIIRQADSALQRLSVQIESSRTVQELYNASVEALALALRTNFAIITILSGVIRIRKILHIPGTAQVVTKAMMEAYTRLLEVPDISDRQIALDSWLDRFGHRGPFESDPARPRFSELREQLARDIALQPTTIGSKSRKSDAPHPLFRPFFLLDVKREWFRDELMRRWQPLRARLLAEGTRLVAEGRLDSPEDLFRLHPSDVEKPGLLQSLVRDARAGAEALKTLSLPATSSRDEIERLIAAKDMAYTPQDYRTLFPGIALSPSVIEGPIIKAAELMDLITDMEDQFSSDTILVVPTLEPSWAIVFPRFAGVIAELGGELSHASILLREARRPAIVNCEGIYGNVQNGDRVRLDGQRGLVEVLGGH